MSTNKFHNAKVYSDKCLLCLLCYCPQSPLPVKKLFYFGIVLLLVFEMLNVYFIMPMPGSQRMNSIDLAYFLYSYRWIFRTVILLLIIYSFLNANWKRKWIPVALAILVAPLIYVINFKMQADHMFLQTKKLVMADALNNKSDLSGLIIGVEKNGFAKAYPVAFLGYHHQVLDSLNGEPIMVTYCTVCRTGRVYQPKVNGRYEKFRLVGMDHFNAMFEDVTTKSWWRQQNGEAITGKLKGVYLPEILSSQTSLSEWLQLHPNSLVMQPDETEAENYVSENYETGISRSTLTGTDTLSWKEKSWVIGVKINDQTKAYDWNQLIAQRIIHDQIGNIPVLVLVSSNRKGFFAFERNVNDQFTLTNDTLFCNNQAYMLNGRATGNYASLKQISAYQEFWHSWRTFNPHTKVY